MNSSAFHLNLLKSSEVLSPSPIRMRVMLPLILLLGCIGMATWWGMLFSQVMTVKSLADKISEDIASKDKTHAEILERQAKARELELQLEQLDYYKASVRQIGEPLTSLAEVMPPKVQLTRLSIKPPLAQILQPPGAKQPLLGPVENVETQKVVVVGKTTTETPVLALMQSLNDAKFSRLVTNERDIKSFKQDEAQGKGEARLLAFEVEYTMPERRFAK